MGIAIFYSTCILLDIGVFTGPTVINGGEMNSPVHIPFCVFASVSLRWISRSDIALSQKTSAYVILLDINQIPH